MNIGQFVHFSIDDVIRCFQWIYEAQPDSIFDEPMLKKVKEWHDTYKLHCDLYVFEKCHEFTLEQLQDRYWEELKQNSSWLKLAWHQADAKEKRVRVELSRKMEMPRPESKTRVDLFRSRRSRSASATVKIASISSSVLSHVQ